MEGEEGFWIARLDWVNSTRPLIKSNLRQGEFFWGNIDL
jgi:hypothetical protein